MNNIDIYQFFLKEMEFLQQNLILLFQSLQPNVVDHFKLKSNYLRLKYKNCKPSVCK